MYKDRENMTTKDYEEYQEGLEYSEEVKNAVRYGYQYRKEAESHIADNIKYCLGDVSDILYWIANMIIGGLSWDLLKGAVRKVYDMISTRGIKTDKETNDILTDETHLKTFYVYVNEFHNHSMSVDNNTLNCIKEEIIADYAGETIGEIISKENRIPETEEYVKIIRETIVYADSLLDIERNTKDQQNRSKQDS